MHQVDGKLLLIISRCLLGLFFSPLGLFPKEGIYLVNPTTFPVKKAAEQCGFKPELQCMHLAWETEEFLPIYMDLRARGSYQAWWHLLLTPFGRTL